jgi:hypothetical protein
MATLIAHNNTGTISRRFIIFVLLGLASLLGQVRAQNRSEACPLRPGVKGKLVQTHMTDIRKAQVFA